MNTLPPSVELNDEVLLKSFSQDDFEMARSSLLDRYQIWQGLLISTDEKTVITPDDAGHFRTQAANLLEQELKSELEWEQLKISAVLIYLLMEANKTALPVGDYALQEQLDQNKLPHANHYIVRKIIYATELLTLAEIKRLLQYQNLIIADYNDGNTANVSDSKSSLSGLQSKDGIYFNLEDSLQSIGITIAEKPQAAQISTSTAATPEPTVPLSGAETETVILRDDQRKTLVETLANSRLQIPVEIVAASYIGMNREHNEDGIVIQPDQNQVMVIDAMGSYGNGVTARDIFIKSLLRHPDNIEIAAAYCQKLYDNNDIQQGGVCILGVTIRKESDYFTIDIYQAGDVHAVLFDQQGTLRQETSDEAIGHQVMNAIVSYRTTIAQQANGWTNFGKLTRMKLHAKTGWRMAIYSDGISNLFHSVKLGEMIINKTPEQSITTISDELHEAMSKPKGYRDNSSIAILDFK